MSFSNALQKAIQEIDEMHETNDGRIMMQSIGCHHPHYFGLLSNTLNDLNQAEKAYIEKYSLEKFTTISLH